MRGLRPLAGIAALLALTAAQAPPPGVDPLNPSCPLNPDWSASPTMQLTKVERDGQKVLLAEGRIDDGLVPRLRTMLDANPDIAEIWLRSPGGNAQVGNEAGRLIRKYSGLATRIPRGWACFSACNFVFMGGQPRFVDPGGLFIVHMFTFTSDGGVIATEASEGFEQAVDTISQVERDAAMLASDDNDFMIRMGVSRALLTEVMYRQKAVAGRGADKSTRRCLTPAEIAKYNVANSG